MGLILRQLEKPIVSTNTNNGSQAGTFTLNVNNASYYGWQKYANAWNLYTKTITSELRSRMQWITTTVNNPLKGIL